MGRAPCCSKVGLHRGPWTPREDSLLVNYIQSNGEGQWRSLPKKAGLLRCGKSCRLRWMNYLRPDIKRGNITPDEEDLIIRLNALLGNRWSLIAGRLPGRTDNEIKNYWNTHLSKRVKSQGTDPNGHKKLPVSDTSVHKEPGPAKKRKSCPTGGPKPNPANKKKKGINRTTGSSTLREKTKIHSPKPVRVTSLTLTRNNSFESDITTSSLGSGCLYGPSDGDGPWVINDDQDQRRHLGHLMGCCDEEMGFVRGYNDAPLNDDKQLEEIYKEYLKLIKADNVVVVARDDNDDEQADEMQLDLFAESLLV